MHKGLLLKSHLSHLWSRMALFQEADRNLPKMCKRNTVPGEKNQTLPPQVGPNLVGAEGGGRRRSPGAAGDLTFW